MRKTVRFVSLGEAVNAAKACHKMSKRIGIFAGTFDPVHDGHIAFANATLDLGLEKIMFLPEPRPRRKQGVKALEHRIAMVQLAVANYPKFGTIILEQARFTAHETLPILRAMFPGHKLVLLFGDDVVNHISSWPNVEKLVNVYELVIASRHKDISKLESTIQTLQKTTNLKFNYQIIPTDSEKITSSKIRLGIRHGKQVIGLAPEVSTYITKNRLYASE